ncbi:domain-containing 3 [Octopus vulgaris]|uniref:Domain-containing 3 n=2 Tax=Octopus TaxID=6643 RepID=A0AA36BJ94_OCTVU|nr:tudor domain-containing protein 3 [Octopus sinensis]CAI9734462.1 domain-containing 3 [Octopus vulgaris]
MANSVLSEKGWHLTETGIAEYLENGNKSVDAIMKMALDVDLRNIGQKFLPDDINRGKIDYIQGPCVLQIQKIRNVSAPKEHEESQAAPRLLKLSLTDGHCTCYGIELESINSVSLNTPPGSKVLFTGTIPVENGFLQLNGKNTKGIGGRVEKLVENWELKRRLAKQHRAGIISEGGPPPFIPFGPRMTKSQLVRTDNFKSLEVSKEKKESEEFVNQRKATIAEAVQAKEEGKIKTFGGNKQALNDKDVARLVEMGFVTEQACQALRQNNGNVNQAIVFLLGKSGPGGRDGRGGNLSNSTGGQLKNTAKLGGEKPEKFHGREKKGRKNKEDKENGNEDVPSRPSGPATLFDYLETKIPIKEDSKTHTESKVSDSKKDVVYDNNNKSDYDGRQNSDNRKSAGNRRNNLPPRLSGKANNSDSAQSNSNTNHSSHGHSSNYTSNNYSANSYSGGHGFNNNDNSSGNNSNIHSFNSGSNSGYPATAYCQDYNNSNHYQQRYNCNSSHGNYNNTLVPNNSANTNHNYNQRGYNKYENTSSTLVGSSNRSGGQDQNHVLNNNNNNPSTHYNHPHQQQRYNNHASVQGNTNNRAVFHQGYHSDLRQAGMVSGPTPRQTRSYCHNQGHTQQHTPYFNVSSGPTQQQQQHPSQSAHYSNDVNARYPPYNQKDVHQHHQQPQHPPQHHNVSGSLGAENPNKIMNRDFQQQMFSPVAHGQKMLDNLNMSEITDVDPRHVISYDGSNGRNNYSYNTANRPKGGGIGSSGGSNCHKKQVDIDSSDLKHERKNNPSPNVVNIHSWRNGDHCLAKYWEDKKFYPAVIDYVAPDHPTCVVTFLEYGNFEEVMLADVKPVSKSWHENSKQNANTRKNQIGQQGFNNANIMSQSGPVVAHQQPHSHQPSITPQIHQQMPPTAQYTNEHVLFQQSHISTMEFRRGGGGYSRRIQQQIAEKMKPTQQYYMPPAQRALKQ